MLIRTQDRRCSAKRFECKYRNLSTLNPSTVSRCLTPSASENKLVITKFRRPVPKRHVFITKPKALIASSGPAMPAARWEHAAPDRGIRCPFSCAVGLRVHAQVRVSCTERHEPCTLVEVIQQRRPRRGMLKRCIQFAGIGR